MNETPKGKQGFAPTNKSFALRSERAIPSGAQFMHRGGWRLSAFCPSGFQRLYGQWRIVAPR